MTAAPSPSALNAAALKAEMASRILSRRRLLPFVKRMNPKYLAGWVHEDICARLERFSDDVAKGLSPRLMILMPPRHGKSELASKTFPAWHIGRHPDHEIIACSYAISLSIGFSRKVKALLDDPGYQTVFDARLDPNNQSSEEWGVAGNSGGYVAAGVGGGITGKGAHVLIIDDPIKNAEEAASATTREALWDWYGSTAYTRLAPGGGVLVIQTWWHDDDLAGRLQQAMARSKVGTEDDDVDQFEIVKYPAIAESDEWFDKNSGEIVRVAHSIDTVTGAADDEGNFPVQDDSLRAYARASKLGFDTTNMKFLRCKGAPLHVERYDLRKLNRIKGNILPRFWSALYQQNPVPDDGVFFTKDQFKRAMLPSRKTSYVHQAWDFAISTKQQNDWTVGSCGLQDEDDMLHIAEVVRFKSGDAFMIVDSILGLAKRWYHPSLRIGVEDGQIWRSIESLLKKRMKELSFYPSIVVLKPITDKQARASTLQGRMQQGMVSFNIGADWYDTVRNEMLRFPAGIHDDCVDSLAWLAQVAMDRPAPKKPVPKKYKSWKDQLRAGTGTVGHMAA